MADATGRVSYDSRRTYSYGSRLKLDAQPYTPSGLGTDNNALPALRGMLHDPDGTDWLFVGQGKDPANPRAQLFAVAIRAPRLLTPIETLRYYAPDLMIPLFQAGLIGLLVAFVMSVIVARSIARPLQDVANAASALAKGDLDHRAPVGGPREVRTLAQAFNAMAKQVGESQQAQRDFLANVTHDLKTPLTSIQGFSQAIIDGVASNPTAAQRAAQVIYDEAGRLNRMVQELLDLARIEAGRLKMTQHVIGLTDVLNGVGERLAPRVQELGLTLRLDVPPLPTVAGDGDRLVQVYTNLIDNAINHTPPGGTITLRAALQDGGVLVQVADTGEGIPAADLPHVFDRFYQVDKSRQRGKHEGAGLGLTIVKGIVDAHGGRLWVESQEGVGTTFSTWFPALSSDSTTITARRRSGLFKTPAPKPTPER
jgi:two-component system OmpR family sensor kinase